MLTRSTLAAAVALSSTVVLAAEDPLTCEKVTPLVLKMCEEEWRINRICDKLIPRGGGYTRIWVSRGDSGEATLGMPVTQEVLTMTLEAGGIVTDVLADGKLEHGEGRRFTSDYDGDRVKGSFSQWQVFYNEECVKLLPELNKIF